MYQKIIIITGGRLGDPTFFQKRLAEMPGFLTICCDSGIRHAKKLKIRPDVIVGDMDSADIAELKKYEQRGVKLLRHPSDKDATDTQLGLEYALKLNPESIEIWGALGGRVDHALANLFLLGLGEKKGIQIKLVDEYCEIMLVSKKTLLRGAVGQTVSLLPLTARVAGVSLKGFRYPLDGRMLKMISSRGISNVVMESPAAVTLDSGRLLLVRYMKKDFFPEAL